MNAIVMQCERKSSTHVRLTFTHPGLLVEYGKLVGSVPRFVAITYDQINLGQNPELLELHDGVGWNIAALCQLVNEFELGFDFSRCKTDDLEQAIADGNLIKVQGQFRLTENGKRVYFLKPLEFDGDDTQPIDVSHIIAKTVD